MPIPVAQLQEANRPLRERILDFLRKNPGQAYSVPEILAGLEGWSEMGSALAVLLLFKEPGPAVPIKDALTTLEAEGLVHSAKQLNVPYYAIRSP
jgi:hypothetical protein